ncbi:hypothetical protein DY000_02040533 [Brassica cretica]|uniref:LOB domain-containing protein n=1 Tax=Brassica cretica TaxID=69181 RepID=A0ABQ7B6R7_BRACR|nr:hypothetical protein DY000_02040533 [Brassica cretica]
MEVLIVIHHNQTPPATSDGPDRPPAAQRRPVPRKRVHSGSSSHVSESSQEQNLIPPLAAPPQDPSTRYEPGVMPIATLVRQPGRDHLKVLHPQPRGYTTWFNKSHNGITACINAMMYSMLRKRIQDLQCDAFRRKGDMDSLIRDVIDLVQTKNAELLASQPMNSDDDSTAAFTNLCRIQINEMVEQLQNKNERIKALETQNATILAALADQKKTNNEIIDKMKCLFPDEFQ